MTTTVTDRPMSPTAAAAHARRAIKARLKAQRMSKRVDPPAVFADRLVTFAQATAEAFPVEPSPAYRQYVESAFFDRYVELAVRQ